MKKMLMLVMLLLVVSLSASASTLISTEEKEKAYTAAVVELESYLENPTVPGRSLSVIINEFKKLEQYQYSSELMYYAMTLRKIEADEYDSELNNLSEILLASCSDRIERYIVDNVTTKIVSVDKLLCYKAGRYAEKTENRVKAIEQYKACAGFYDSAKRLAALLSLSPSEEAEAETVVYYQENGFYVYRRQFCMINKRVLQSSDKYTMIQKIMEAPEDNAASVGDTTPDALHRSSFATYSPVFAIYFVQDSATEGVIAKETLLRKGDQEWKSTATLEGLPSGGVLYDDLGELLTGAGQWLPGRYMVQITFNEQVVLDADLFVSEE